MSLAALSGGKQRIPSGRAAALGLAMLAAVVAHAGRPPRNFAYVATEQIVAEQMFGMLDWRDPDRSRRQAELERRPAEELRRVAFALVEGGDPFSLAAAGSLLNTVAKKLGPNGKAEIRAQVEAMLVDGDASVRAHGLQILGCIDDIDQRVPEAAWVVARELLRSPQPEVCASALTFAVQRGSDVAPLRDALVDFIRRYTGNGLRLMATVVLGRVRPVDPELQQLRLDLLQDREANVRYGVAMWYSERPDGGAAAIPRLLAIAQDLSEDDDTRRASLSALARLITEREAAEPVFAELLQRAKAADPGLIEPFCVDLGRLASAVVGSPLLANAAAWLRSLTEDEPSRTIATATLAHCAIADPSVAFGASDVDVLRAALTQWHENAELDPGTSYPAPGAQAAVEALVKLAARGTSGVQTPEIRQLLDRVAKCKQGWLRDWANDQLRALPQ